MDTECSVSKLQFQGLGRRRVEAEFNGGQITSDAGGLLLREVESRYGFIRGLAACFGDRRDPRFTEFSVEELVGQRIYGLALGYEDVNDHEELRADPLMAVLVGKEDPLGRDRRPEADRGKACAGKSTLNRLELSSVTQDKYRKTPVDEAAVEAFLVEQFIRVRGGKPKELVLDLDATDDPLHGEQEGRFYHGYYRCYCYLPLYVFCEGYVLGAKLRMSNLDGSEGAVQEMERIVGQLRAKWPKVRITLRGDSGFAREALMKWCEEHRVDYGGRGTMERKRTLSRDRAQFPGGFSRSRSSRRVVAYGTSVSLAMARIDISGFCARSSRTCRRVLSSKRGRPTCFPSIRALAIPAFTRSDSRMPSWFASAASSPISASLKIPVESR